MTTTWVTRAQWDAARSKGGENPKPLHVYGLAVHYSEGNVGKDQHGLCARRVRAIQRHHQQTKGYADIAYSFLVCQHGFTFVGRGTVAGSASQGSTDGNRHYWSVCWLGGPLDTPTPLAKAAIVDLRTYLQQRGMGLKVRPHHYFSRTLCPGVLVSTWLRSRWSMGTL